MIYSHNLIVLNYYVLDILCYYNNSSLSFFIALKMSILAIQLKINYIINIQHITPLRLRVLF